MNDVMDPARAASENALERPFDKQPGRAEYAALPPDWAQQIEVSCSS